MDSIVDLMNAIAGNPLVDAETRIRAGFLASRILGRDPFASIFEGLR